jgi:hypothetical protein
MQAKERAMMSRQPTGIGNWIRRLLGKRRGETQGSALAQAPAWKRLEATWNQAQRIIEGDLTALPTSGRAQKKFAQAFADTADDIRTLRRCGHLSDCEADLLAARHSSLAETLSRHLDTDTHAQPSRPTIPARASINRLAQRIDMLELLAASEALHPEAVDQILAGVHRDVETLSNRAMLQQLAMARRAEAGDLRNRVTDLVETLRRRLCPYRMTA